MLRRYGLDMNSTKRIAYSRKKYWRLANTPDVQRTLTTKRLRQWSLAALSPIGGVCLRKILNRRLRNRTYDDVRGRELVIPPYSILFTVSDPSFSFDTRRLDGSRFTLWLTSFFVFRILLR